ncbi:MAG: maleylpyruvate isomerase N-terminal domain-containing protein [Frankiaceae bacterium]
MTGTRDDFLATARSAVQLLREPAVADAWDRPSALPGLSVGGLAGHLAYQIVAVAQALAGPVPDEPAVPLLGHYERVRWIGAPVDADVNVRIRQEGEEAAADGPAALAAGTSAIVDQLAADLPAAPERPVRIPLWGPWSLLLGDLLVTRMMELAVHADDLAVSVGVATPQLPDGAVAAVVDLLSRLAVRRHGPTAVLRALSRAERAPAVIAAI